jgi:hypothetical protein
MRGRIASTLAILGVALLAGCGRASYRADLAQVKQAADGDVDLGAPMSDVIARRGRPDAIVPLGSGTFALEYRHLELEAKIPGRVRSTSERLSYVVRREKVIAQGTFHDSGEARGAALSAPVPPLASRSALVTLALGVAVVTGFALAHAIRPRARRAAVRLGIGLAILAAATFGHERRGPFSLETVSEGSPVSELVKQHGAPDETVALPDDSGLLFRYTIRDRRDDVLWGSDELSSITYLVQGGRVVRSGPVVHELVAAYLLLRFYETDASPLDAATLGRTLGAFGIVLALFARRNGRRARKSRPWAPGETPPPSGSHGGASSAIP